MFPPKARTMNFVKVEEKVKQRNMIRHNSYTDLESRNPLNIKIKTEQLQNLNKKLQKLESKYDKVFESIPNYPSQEYKKLKLI